MRLRGNFVAHSLASTGAAFTILFAVVGASFVFASANPVTVSREPWIGIQGTNMTPAIAQAAGTNEKSGFLVTRVLPGSPAEKADIRGGDRTVNVGNEQVLIGGDIIIELEGQPVTGATGIQKDFQQRQVGDTMHFTIVRGSVTSHVSVLLEEKPA